ncbi:YwiC-like family protein [Actinomyces sp. MRS3W]|uniref:YwiC-like family protein n=1 Tax=Actinomyces sp. MRS3W TaxID=2800796 RepID=UPI0028FD9DC1|nr:YwiC-like family protein [Actinomyces sp. MRS3W]MDU0347362.1 YwiC-like family protein [Actinomyces sp. MRS3W]
MTQQRPSDPADRHVEYVSGLPEDPAETADAPASAEGTPRGHIPYQQSRPGPEDDRLLATGEPVRASSGSADRPVPTGSTSRPVRGPQSQQRAQADRRAWMPDQHGAHYMLLLPPIMGWVVGGFSWVNLLFIPAWLGAYLTYWAWSQWARARSPRRRALALPPLAIYTSWTALLGIVTLAVAPYLLQWAVPLTPLFAVALWEAWRGRERSLLSGLAATAAASLISAVTYSLAVGGRGGFLGLGPDATSLPGTSPNGELTGWPWMWLVTAFTTAYFCSTVPYIKSMIRERFNRPLLAGTAAWHGLVAAAAVWLATGGFLPWAHAVLWVVLAVRSAGIPLWQWHLVRTGQTPLRPKVMGVTEIVFCLFFLLTIAFG